jgi:multidrug transporter EmrE-like cation transporter
MRTLLFLAANLGANTGAHICLKHSAVRTEVRAFLFWQVVGNLGGFLGVLAYTALLRDLSLHVAYPLTEGLTAIGVQVVGGLIVFREKIPAAAWAGTGLILAGIILFSL